MIDKIKEKYGVNDTGAARLLGVDKGTISKYQSGTQTIPKRILHHIDSLIRHDAETVEQIKRDRLK